MKDLLEILGEKKYISFRGRVFLDAFFPGYPGPVFDRLLDSMVRTDAARPQMLPYVLLAITSDCEYRCRHCCTGWKIGKRAMLSASEWSRIIADFQSVGTAVFSFEGGEPLLRFDELVRLCRQAQRTSEPWIVTTGYGLTAQRARRLADAGMVGALVSLDHFDPDTHNAFRGHPQAFEHATRAVRLFAEAGILPSLNLCVTHELLRGDGLYRYLQLAKELGAGVVQILDLVQAGNLMKDEGVALSPEEVEKLRHFQRVVNTSRAYRDHPAVSVRVLLENSNAFGCGAGGNTTLYVDSAGNLQPCGFMATSTGNLLDEPFETVLGRMRALFPHPIAFDGLCPANELRLELAALCEESGEWPLGYEHSRKLCARFTTREPPRLYWG